jgi:hypothetical protein
VIFSGGSAIGIRNGRKPATNSWGSALIRVDEAARCWPCRSPCALRLLGMVPILSGRRDRRDAAPSRQGQRGQLCVLWWYGRAAAEEPAVNAEAIDQAETFDQASCPTSVEEQRKVELAGRLLDILRQSTVGSLHQQRGCHLELVPAPPLVGTSSKMKCTASPSARNSGPR